MGEPKNGRKLARSTNILHDFGLKRHYLYESVVGVLDGDGKPHFAPLGIRVIDISDEGRFEFEARVFTTAILYPCLKRCGECIVHFPGHSQLDLFFVPFRDALPGLHEKVAAPGNIAPGRSVDSPVIKNVANYMEAGVTWVKDENVNDAITVNSRKDAVRGVFRLASRAVIIGDPGSRPISRHDGLTIELLVKASRFRFLPPGSEEQHANLSDLLAILATMESIAPGDEKNVLARALLASLKDTLGARP